MGSDVFSHNCGCDCNTPKEYETWYEREKRTWLEFRNGCKGKIGQVCYIMDAKLICREDVENDCPLWFAACFKSRSLRK